MPFQLLVEPEKEYRQVIPKSFCWRESLVNRYESLWSLLHKFALLNSIEAKDLRDIFAFKYNRENVNAWKWRHRDDLRCFWGLDASKLTLTLNNNEKLINESVVSAFVKENEVLKFSCENLKFCKKCLKSGFHSSLYQLLFINRCPVHEADLITKCPKCKNNIPYKFDNIAFKNPYKCPKCKLSFCPTLTKIGCQLPKIDGREEALTLIGGWLIKRIDLEILESKINEKNSRFIDDSIDSKITCLTAFWSDVYRPSVGLKPILEKQLDPKYNNFK